MTDNTNEYSNLKTIEVARRINEYLKKFAASPEIAVRKRSNSNSKLKIFCDPTVDANILSARLYIRYVRGETSFMLTKAQAIQYLVWLDDGNVGRHFSCFNGGK